MRLIVMQFQDALEFEVTQNASFARETMRYDALHEYCVTIVLDETGVSIMREYVRVDNGELVNFAHWFRPLRSLEEDSEFISNFHPWSDGIPSSFVEANGEHLRD